MIKRFSCRNFRNVNVEDLTFERINILIGPNNAGKSNFIKALTFYSDLLINASEGNVKTAFLNAVARNGWDHAHNKYTSDKEPIDFSWAIDLEGTPVCYRFSYTVGTSLQGYNISLEELNTLQNNRYRHPFNYFRCHNERLGEGYFSTAVQKGKVNKRIPFQLSSQEILPVQFDQILLKDKELYGDRTVRDDVSNLLSRLGEFFRGAVTKSEMSFKTKKMRKPSDMKLLDDRLSPNGENFANVFSRYAINDFRWRDLFIRKMRELIPQLKMAEVGIKYDQLLFSMVFEEERYDLSDVSEGTLKALILNMLINMQTEQKTSVLAIDEPETNLHPAWQKVIGHWIQTTETVDQFFLSTHSPDFLDTFTEGFVRGQVGVFSFDPGRQEVVKKIEYKDIADELGDWELGDLYRTNDPALGGWPW